MPEPWDDLATRLKAEPNAPNIYPTPEETITAPAIVIRPDAPWAQVEGYATMREQYVATCVASASSPGSAMVQLREMRDRVYRAAMAGDSDWSFIDAGRVVIDTSTGTPFLACAVRLSYRTEVP